MRFAPEALSNTVVMKRYKIADLSEIIYTKSRLPLSIETVAIIQPQARDGFFTKCGFYVHDLKGLSIDKIRNFTPPTIDVTAAKICGEVADDAKANIDNWILLLTSTANIDPDQNMWVLVHERA